MYVMRKAVQTAIFIDWRTVARERKIPDEKSFFRNREKTYTERKEQSKKCIQLNIESDGVNA